MLFDKKEFFYDDPCIASKVTDKVDYDDKKQYYIL